MQTVNISDFRANLLSYLESANSGVELQICSKGKVLATISPPQNRREQAKTQLAALASTAQIGDVINPIDSEWEAML
jgi:antitoxin (DNA-binding transcriptional repressor) of toxin-antitoxin stability system